MSSRHWSVLLVAFPLACGARREESNAGGGPLGGDDGIPGASTGIGGDGDGDGDDGVRLDVAAPASGGIDPCGQEGGADCTCEIIDDPPCDGDDDVLHAIGIACPGAAAITGTVNASPKAIGVRSGFGPSANWAPTEGQSFAVLSSGDVALLDVAAATFDPQTPGSCNVDLGGEWDVGNLPPPLRPEAVAGDCAANPGLIGSGDCSRTIEAQWAAGMVGGSTCTINGMPCCVVEGTPCPEDMGAAQDYSEIRVQAKVPAGATSLSYDLAFFTVEWPFYFDSQYNDLYIGWLESEQWTGNISFDENGEPISLNAAFFDYLDHNVDLPEFQDTCMQGHGGTKWLQTTAPVTPGEDITVVFAIMDLSDSILDSFVFLDNWQWGCDGLHPPETVPVG